MYGVDVACTEVRWVYARNPQLLNPAGWLIPNSTPLHPPVPLAG